MLRSLLAGCPPIGPPVAYSLGVRLTHLTPFEQFDMRLIGWFLLLLVGLIWLASELPADKPSSGGELAANWRRTTQGWEQLALPATDSPAAVPTLHPAAVEALEILLVLGAMVAFSAAPPRSQKRGGEASGAR